MEQTDEPSPLVTTYGLVRRMEWLQQLAWQFVVVDEAQTIKNAWATQT